eukprot:g1155.t1
MVLAKFIAGKLQEALADFVEPGFKLELGGTTITLANVTLKPGVIPASVPFKLRYGWVGRVVIKVPLFNLGSEPITATVQDVVVVFGPHPVDTTSFSSAFPSFTKEKQARVVKAAKQAFKRVKALRGAAVGGAAAAAEQEGKGKKKDTFLSRLIKKAI